MDRKALLEHLNWLNTDTSSLNNDGVACYRFALKRVAEFVNAQPLDKDEAAKILNDWVEWAQDANSNPNDTPYSDKEILEAMKIGAAALMQK